MKHFKEHLIWSNYPEEIDALMDDYNNSREIDAEPLDYYAAAELNAEYLDDECVNLRGIETNQIIAIADIGRWNGRRTGYALRDSVASCLRTTCDYAEFYVDADFCSSCWRSAFLPR